MEKSHRCCVSLRGQQQYEWNITRATHASKGLGHAWCMLAVLWLGLHISKHISAHCDAFSATFHACQNACVTPGSQESPAECSLSDSKEERNPFSKTGWSDTMKRPTGVTRLISFRRSKLVESTIKTLGKRLFDKVILIMLQQQLTQNCSHQIRPYAHLPIPSCCGWRQENFIQTDVSEQRLADMVMDMNFHCESTLINRKLGRLRGSALFYVCPVSVEYFVSLSLALSCWRYPP